jgi:hypothetical protein
MALTKPKRLVRALFDKTQAGSVDWHEGVGADTFQVSFKDNSVQLGLVEGRSENVRDYVISVLNEEGTVVDRFSDEELDEEDGVPAGQGGEWYQRMKELYNMALRHARGADKALNAILGELEGDFG